MDHLNGSSRIRQQRLRDNLRWYLKRQPLLEEQAQAGDSDSSRLVAAFEVASRTLAESKIDLFNDVVEQYQASISATKDRKTRSNVRDTARA